MPVVSAGINFNMTLNESESLGSFGGSITFAAVLQKILQFSALGSAAGQLNAGYVKDRTVSTGTPDVLTLTDGSILQPDGVTAATFNDVLAMALYNGGTTGQNITIGGGSGDIPDFAVAGVPIYPGMLYFVGGNIAQGRIITDLVTIGGVPTGGTFTLSVTAGGSTQTTAGIAYNATAAVVQAALIALSNVGTSNAVVTGSAGGPYTVNFTPAVGAWTMTGSAGGLTGGTPTITLALSNKIHINVAAGSNVPYQVMLLGH